MRYSLLFLFFLVTSALQAQDGSADSLLQKDRQFLKYLLQEEKVQMINSLLHSENAFPVDENAYRLMQLQWMINQKDSLETYFRLLPTWSPYFEKATALYSIGGGSFKESGVLSNDSVADLLILVSEIHLIKNSSWHKLELLEKQPVKHFGSIRENIHEIGRQSRAYAPPSPALAGVMSAIIPGSGKIYYGKRSQGLFALGVISALGLLTYEGYKNSGTTGINFYLFGSLGTIFYLGNIWGSVSGAKIKRNEDEETFRRGLDTQLDYLYNSMDW